MSLAHHHDPSVPRGALIAAAMLVTFSMSITGAVRLGWLPGSAQPVAERAAANVGVLESRSLHFADAPGGQVLVSDAKSGALIQTLLVDEGGFIRAVVRGMANDRMRRGIGSEPPFQLTSWANGALSLRDTATGREVDLHGFGADNRAVFEQLFKGSPS